jgi:CHC2 zinc finger/RepB DNA-primase from phage plasmid
MGAEFGVGGRAATRRFLAALYRLAPAGALVEVRFSVASGMARRFLCVAEIDGVVDAVAGLARWTDVFVGVVPRRRRGGRREDLVERASVVWVDCDSDESVAALAAFRPRPAIQVASGSGRNRHAYWVSRDAVGLDMVEQINRRLALELGAYARCSDAARILRPAGSTNWKSGRPAAVRLIALDEQHSLDVAELDRRLPALPAAPEAADRRRWSPRAAGEDRLLAVSPRVYVERLMGAPVGRSGKVRCPFHEDHTPSLHVYEDPQRGWYCFGCGRGGSIYDFAALLLGRGTRGEAFIELRRELAAIIG